VEDGPGVDGDSAGLLIGVGELVGDALAVGVEDDADEFAGAVDDGAAGVAAGDVGGADEIQGDGGVEFILGIFPTRWESVRVFVAVLLLVVESAGNSGPRGDP
jgi:hypothetical protein